MEQIPGNRNGSEVHQNGNNPLGGSRDHVFVKQWQF